MTPLAQAALMVSVAVSNNMEVHDSFEAKFERVTHKGEERGSYKVVVVRTA